MNKFVIDTYAWVEYFIGSKIGENVKAVVEDKNNEIYTNAITIAELSSSYTRDSLNFEDEKKILTNMSKIIEINIELADATGKLHANIKKNRKHMSMADTFVLATARKLNAKVVTGDEDFRGLNEVIMIK